MTTDQAESGASTVRFDEWWTEVKKADPSRLGAALAAWRFSEKTIVQLKAELAEAKALLEGQADRIDVLLEETRRWGRLFVGVADRAEQAEAERDAMREVVDRLEAELAAHRGRAMLRLSQLENWTAEWDGMRKVCEAGVVWVDIDAETKESQEAEDVLIDALLAYKRLDATRKATADAAEGK